MSTTLRDIPFARPDFDQAEARAVADVLASGWASQGPAVARFEEQFAARVGARYGIASLCVGVGQGVATVVEALEP